MNPAQTPELRQLLTLLTLAAFASSASFRVCDPMLPVLAGLFDAPAGRVARIITGFTIAYGAMQLIYGPLGERFDRFRIVTLATALCAVGSLGATLATRLDVLTLCRILTGVAAAGIIPMSIAAIADMVPAEQAASMIGYVTMAMSVVPMIGPAVGGALDEWFGWQASFVLLAIAGVMMFALVWADLGETAHPSGRSLAAQLAEYPELLRSPRFWGYAGVASLASGAFFAYLGGSPFVGEKVLHLSPAIIGYYFAAPAIGYAVGNFLAGRYSMRVGLDRMVLIGTTFSTVTLIMGATLAHLLPAHPMLFFPAVGLMAIGNGITLPNANAGLLSVRPHLAGSASGLGGALMIGGGAVLAAITGPLLSEKAGHYVLLEVMAASSALSVLCILMVIRRARRLAR